jgi:hypothetical protein
MAFIRFAPGGEWIGSDINNGKIQIDMPIDPAHYAYTDEHQSYWINLSEWISGIIVDTSFTDLEDAPSSYTDQALKLVRVNATETGLEFVDGAASISFSPTTYTTSTNVQAAIEEVQEDAIIEFISMACSDVSTAIATGTNKANFAFNFNFTLLAVFGKLDTVCTGSSFIFDINNGENSFLSTKLSIDASENTSLTAATPAVIDATYQDYTAGTKITVDFDQVGATIAGAGAGIILKVRRTS